MEAYLAEQNLDDLGRMVLALLSELWIVRDRVAILEARLAEKGRLESDTELDDYTPGPELAKRLDGLRDRMIAGVLGAPQVPVKRHVDDVLARAGMARPMAAPSSGE